MPQDFSGQNLSGRSFKGQNLEGANFSGTDIRSCDFTLANLRGANFSHATAGLQKRWAIFLVCVLWLLSGISGFFSAFTGALITFIFDSSSSLENQVGGWTALIVVIVIFIVILRQGLNSAIAIIGAIAIAITGAITGAIAFAYTIAGIITISMNKGKVETGTFVYKNNIITGTVNPEAYELKPITGAIAIIAAIAGAGIAITGTGALTIATAIAITGSGALTIAGVITIAITAAGALTIAIIITGSGALTITIDIAIAITGALFSVYIALQAMKGDEKYALIRNIAVVFAATGGTKFRNANLSKANFTAATLKSTDFRKANLTRTCFNKAKKLDRVRPGTTYLQKAQVVRLLTTLQAQGKNFDREDLRGVNFQGANLADASFIGANLSQANFQDADLSRAKLVQTQLDGTDFTGATLTGAYIQDWGITTDTKFDGVRCEWVYMRLPTKENPDPLRKPDNHKEVFADGEFGDFIQPIFDTLDLYHNQGVDPRAIAISFKQLAENHPDAELEIVAMEKRGQDKFLLRAKTAIAADKSQLSAEYFATYNQLKALAEQEVQKLIAEKDSRIADLQTMVVTALQRPSFYAQTYQTLGDTTMAEGSKQVFNNNLSNAQFGGGLVNADTVTASQIGGNITNYTPQQRQNLADAAAEIQQLLNQLSQTYPTTTTSEKMSVVAKAVDEIENNPTLKVRIIGALKAGGTEAFKELIDNPLVNILLASIEGWQDAE